jgi:hypothetical protein
MSNVTRLHEDAQSAYRGGHFREALLFFRQAAGQAEMLGDRAAWFENLVWASKLASVLHDFPLALRLLVDARAAEPPDRPDHEAMLARIHQLEITLICNPLLPRVLEQLDDLRQFAISPADIENILSRIALSRGHFAQAREGYERAWHMYTPSTGGFVKEAHAAGNINCCLEMGDVAGVKQWITALEGVVSSHDYYHKKTVIDSRLKLALLEGASFQELRGFFRASEDLAESEDDCRLFRARVLLLDPDGGDPANRTHPVRQSLARRFGSRWSIDNICARRMLLLDYRLAVLRYAAGITPVDDHYYSQRQALPVRLQPVVAENDLAERVRKARAAADWALASARKLDSALECDYRQRKVEARRERIEEIVQNWLCSP